jgi:hypothetical protein
MVIQHPLVSDRLWLSLKHIYLPQLQDITCYSDAPQATPYFFSTATSLNQLPIHYNVHLPRRVLVSWGWPVRLAPPRSCTRARTSSFAGWTLGTGLQVATRRLQFNTLFGCLMATCNEPLKLDTLNLGWRQIIIILYLSYKAVVAFPLCRDSTLN